MDATRRQEWKASLERELQRQVVERQLSEHAQIAWLLEQLTNYVERWLALGGAPGSAVNEDALFQMVEIGTEVLSEVLRASTLPNEASGACNHFRNLIADARRRNQMPVASFVHESLAGVESSALRNRNP